MFFTLLVTFFIYYITRSFSFQMATHAQEIADDAGDTMTLWPVEGNYLTPFPVTWNVADNYKTITSWEARGDDVMLAAFPKSGIYMQNDYLLTSVTQLSLYR